MFESIIGQDQAVASLLRALNHKVNTYVFYGSRGTFIEEAARIFAARLIDETGSIDERVSKLRYADVIEFEPMGVSYRVKEDVRESMLVESRKSPVEGERKVIVIHDAHLLRADSANTILKSLEEPSENVFWILVAPTKDSLLATIRSRCYEIEFARLSESQIEEILINEGIDPEKAKKVSKSSAGRIDRARSLATYLSPLPNCAQDIATELGRPACSVVNSAKKVVETFDEIASDVVAKNKIEMESIKKEMKDSGYADKIANGIVQATKKRLEAKEKRLRHELMVEFLDSLSQAFMAASYTDRTRRSLSAQSENTIYAVNKIGDYRKRLTYNPSELLFLESLLASISQHKSKVNS